MTIVAYKVDCANIADLNDSNTLKFLGLSSVELACAWEDLATQKQDPPTWKLVDRLQALGVTGIQYRSFAPGCTDQNQNLVLWKWAETPPALFKLLMILSAFRNLKNHGAMGFKVKEKREHTPFFR